MERGRERKKKRNFFLMRLGRLIGIKKMKKNKLFFFLKLMFVCTQMRVLLGVHTKGEGENGEGEEEKFLYDTACLFCSLIVAFNSKGPSQKKKKKKKMGRMGEVFMTQIYYFFF